MENNVTVEDIHTFKRKVVEFVEVNSPVVGNQFIVDIDSPIHYFERSRYVEELEHAGELLVIELARHAMRRHIYIRKNTRFEVLAKHCSVKASSLGYHRIGHGTDK